MAKIEENILSEFHDSLDRCCANVAFFDIFYERFLNSSEMVREKFANTDLERQKRMLQKSLVMMTLAMTGDQASEKYLSDIAERHSSRHLDIPPILYNKWLSCLLETVKCCDNKFTATIEDAWREVMEHGIQFMISKY